MEYLTTAEVSVQWNITPCRIGVLCADGRIDGVNKHGAESENLLSESVSKEMEP